MSEKASQRVLLAGAGYVGLSEAVTRVTRIVTAVALARMMSVEEYGVAAAALTVHELTRMFIQNGLGTRIVTADNNELDRICATVHRMNWALGIFMALAQIAIAVPAARHFGADSIIPALIALSAVHVIYPAAMVQVYLAQRQTRWAMVSAATAAQSAVDNLMMAALALTGFGLWAVVLPKIVIAIGWIVWHRAATPWKPAYPFDMRTAHGLALYAIRIFGVEMLNALRTHADKVVVGAALGPAALGLYAFASNIANGITLSLSQSLSAVLLPFMRTSRETGTLRASYTKSLQIMVVMCTPFVVVQAVLAPWYVPALFGAKWAPAIPLLITLSLASLARPILVATSQLLRALHDTATDLRLGWIATILFFVGLTAGINLGGVMGAATGSSLGLAIACVPTLIAGFRAAARGVPEQQPALLQTAASAGSPAVSVVMACFNAAQTVEASIASIAAQTLCDWELIVVDDGSTDGTTDIVRRASETDGRIRLLVQANAGPSIARNAGSNLARAPLIAFLDADDTWTPEHLARAVTELSGDPSLGVCFGGCNILDQSGKPTGRRTRLWPTGIKPQDVLASNPTATCSSLVIRSEVFKTAGLLRSDMRFAEDQEWLYRVLRHGWTIRSTTAHTVGYRTSDAGLSAQISRMEAGWRTFIDIASAQDGAFVAMHLQRAETQMNFYYCDRALRAGDHAGASRYFFQAVSKHPLAALASPRRMLRFAAALAAPRVYETLIQTLQKVRHV